MTNCLCRQMKDLRGQPCKHSDIRETCLQIGPDHARQYVEMGISRFITRDEVFGVLDRAMEAGFILQPENSQHPENICCCCGDCCGPLEQRREDLPVRLISTRPTTIAKWITDSAPVAGFASGGASLKPGSWLMVYPPSTSTAASAVATAWQPANLGPAGWRRRHQNWSRPRTRKTS